MIQDSCDFAVLLGFFKRQLAPIACAVGLLVMMKGCIKRQPAVYA
ncbi:hypothetical protein N288_25695 [Bacillus infantis NRRL B-14911]|uniref:Uncharacterized protein n=1 Tax=Bacillus infantis NRRL B-14911 TaxID=1367477 RepID=U5LGH7_9BACI|nr:hypothetical protein N288_25695 [Bacillus infantis NRRL B-14911]